VGVQLVQGVLVMVGVFVGEVEVGYEELAPQAKCKTRIKPIIRQSNNATICFMTNLTS